MQIAANIIPKFILEFWLEWIVGMAKFLWQCIRRALFSQWWWIAMSAISIPASMVVAWLLYKHPDWPAAYQAWFNLIFVCLIPITAALLIIVFRLLISPFLVHRDIKKSHEGVISLLKRTHESELAALNLELREQREKAKARETEREKAVRECFQRAAALLKEPTKYKNGREFQGFFQAEPYELQSNEEVMQLCDLLVKAGHKHPFGKIDTHVLESERLDFLKWGKTYKELDFGKNPFHYLKGAYQWNHKVKGRPDKRLGLQEDILSDLEDTTPPPS